MDSVGVLDMLRRYVREWPGATEQRSGAFDSSSGLLLAGGPNEEHFAALKERVGEYLCDCLAEEEVSALLGSSFGRLADVFLTGSSGSGVPGRAKLDISDLFVMLEIVDSEYSISDSTQEYCVLYKDDISGRYGPRVARGGGELPGLDLKAVSALIQHVVSRFNSDNIYSLEGGDLGELLSSSRHVLMHQVHRKKPRVFVNKIHSNQFEAEQGLMSVERSWEVMLFSKLVGLVKTLLLLNNRKSDSEIHAGSFENSSVNETACLLIAAGFAETLGIVQRSNKDRSGRCGTILFLQFELYEILRSQYPYNLVTCIDSVEYWELLRTYLDFFSRVQALMALELSYLPKESERMVEDAYFNRKQSLMDYMFNRVFITANSMELRYYSSQGLETNYLSSFCVLVARYLDPILLPSETNENFNFLIKASMEINMINWVKLSFLCANHVFNTRNDSIQIETGSIIPRSLSRTDFFQDKLVNGYSVMFCGLKILYLLLETTDFSLFLPLVKHVFDGLQVTYCLLSRQDDEEELFSSGGCCADDLRRARRLLDEVVILFSRSVSRKVLGALLASETSVDPKHNKIFLDTLASLIESSNSVV